METLRRYITLPSKTRLPSASSASLTPRAGVVARNFTASSPLNNGNLADICNGNVVSSPYPPIDSSNFRPAPEFVSSRWKDANLVDKVAIRDGTTGETRTFSQYDNNMNSIASALKSEYNLKPEETVALYSLNNVDYLPICLAAGLCGSKITPINPLATAGELARILGASKSKILFSHAKLLPVALEAAKSSPSVEHIVVIPDVESDADLPEGAEKFEQLLKYDNAKAEQYPIGDLKTHPWLLPTLPEPQDCQRVSC